MYLRAVALYYTITREANEAASALLERAIALDPDYAAAMALLSLVLHTRITQGWSAAAEIAADARKHIRLAQQIDGHNPDVLAFQARGIAYLDGRHEEAIALIQRALALNPNSVIALSMAGWVYVYAGQPQPAVTHLHRAMRLNPRDPADFQSWIPLSHAFMQLGRDGEALDTARQAVQRAPNYAASWRVLAAILALTGRLEEAQASMATLLRLAPTMSLTRMKSMPTWSEAARTRYFEGLRLAGMPE